ncbi:MAG: hypothetical protein R3B06_14520 [Kofleriaceae bacterium]
MRARHLVVGLGLVLVAGPAAAQEEPSPADPPAVTAADTTDAAAAAAAPKKTKKKKRTRAEAADFRLGTWRGTVAADAELRAGALAGRSTLRTSGGLIELDAGAEPALERGAWRLGLPLTAAHRETPGAALRETRGGADLDARWKRSAAFRLDLEAGLRLVSRPSWDDQYQPLAGGGLGPTDRYSHRDLRLGAAVTGIPLRHQHARLALRFTDYDYVDDPDYSALDAPTHLVPGDRQTVDLDGSWRYFGDGWKLGGAVAFEDRHDAKNFSRDAGTGKTHAGAGGPPPNPLYHQISVEPSVGVEVDLRGGALELGADLGYAIVSDRYQGYYSWSGLHPEVHAIWKAGALEARAAAELQLASYGAGSYAVGPGHPALESGTRRADSKVSARAAVAYALRPHLALVAGGDVSRRTTNFPDYVPGVFPAGRQYDVQWDYVNWEASAGVRVER